MFMDSIIVFDCHLYGVKMSAVKYRVLLLFLSHFNFYLIKGEITTFLENYSLFVFLL